MLVQELKRRRGVPWLLLGSKTRRRRLAERPEGGRGMRGEAGVKARVEGGAAPSRGGKISERILLSAAGVAGSRGMAAVAVLVSLALCTVGRGGLLWTQGGPKWDDVDSGWAEGGPRWADVDSGWAEVGLCGLKVGPGCMHSQGRVAGERAARSLGLFSPGIISADCPLDRPDKHVGRTGADWGGLGRAPAGVNRGTRPRVWSARTWGRAAAGFRHVGDSRPRHRPPQAAATTTTSDAISRNITLVLDNLLKDYESSQPPTHGQGQPTVVTTNMLIKSMGPISEQDMDYSMDCYFRQYWRDSRLSFVGVNKSLSLSIKMLERIWRPDTYFYNGKNSYVHTITVPNKLLRLSENGDILYSMRLTIKAKCPMQLRNFPMDRQSCPLLLGSYAYTSRELVYRWQSDSSVDFVSGLALSQFDLMSSPQRNLTFQRREGQFSVLQVNFNLQRHAGYFLIQVYVPCTLIVVLSWVSFWIHREATSDRVGLGITTVLTLSTISLDSRTDLPKVRYATALDCFLFMSFFYCIATLLEFAGVHYFTKVGSGEIPVDEEEWEDAEGAPEELTVTSELLDLSGPARAARRRSSLICPIYNDPVASHAPAATRVRVTRHTQTERLVPHWRQFLYCLAGNDDFRRRRQREAALAAGKRPRGPGELVRQVNSVSHIDRTARVVFPASFGLLNILYWLAYYTYQQDFDWTDPPLASVSH
ncbi:gamma-aminobutyric acid receptor subunit alpha-2-like [Bacillus rossius redtenbacheri]|uniref:gamma-aminobutyric acid receptor subunit alpha-2-like n=1 Tax=Bacillus rossius redtenbacheri TaxID=93214 RepID=UPI002FDC9D63